VSGGFIGEEYPFSPRLWVNGIKLRQKPLIPEVSKWNFKEKNE
jgi:hypothetical protein